MRSPLLLCVPLVVGAMLWALPARGQLLSPGKLARPHAELEGLRQCTRCHTPGAQVEDAKCLGCHDRLAARVRDGKGYHARLPGQRCASCHGDHRGLDFSLVRWEPQRFDHDSTGYALEGAHRRLSCDQCHKGSSFLGLRTDCLSCHQDAHRGQLLTDCRSCHTFEAWHPAHLDHGQTRFALRGRHAQVACERCHAQGRFRGLAFATCGDCHADAHRGQLAQDCRQCHSESGWRAVSFDHSLARFQLTGRHTSVACDRCHRLERPPDGSAPLRRFRPLAFGTCSDCHRDPHAPSLGADCQRCHAVAGWRETRTSFDHGQTRFALRGRHAQVACEKCHAQGRFQGLAFAACGDCHADAHRGQLPSDCRQCHSETGWSPSTFDHNRARFTLDGKHTAARCEQCHVLEADASGSFRRFRPLGQACASCHADVHRGQLAGDCGPCHRPAGWSPAVFDHEQARFRLNGKHVGVPCDQCHPLESTADGTPLRRFRPLHTDCAACHG